MFTNMFRFNQDVHSYKAIFTNTYIHGNLRK